MKTLPLITAMAGLACWMATTLDGGVALQVNGLGWRADKRNERLLEDILDIGVNEETAIDASVVEDALILLGNELSRKGYLSPEINYTLYGGENLVASGAWESSTQLPDFPLRSCDRLVLDVTKGVRAYVAMVEFAGLQSIPEAEARSFFVPPGGLIISKASRAHSPLKLESQLRSLQLRLGQLGFQDALVQPGGPVAIGENGEVNLRIQVNRGSQYIWGDAACVNDPAIGIDRHAMPPTKGKPFSTESLQDWIAEVRTQYLQAGYPDVMISANLQRNPRPDQMQVIVDVLLEIKPNARVRLGEVRFTGLEHANEDFLRKLVQLESGSWLSRPEIQAAQFRLGQLGIFERVQAEINGHSTEGQVPVRDIHISVSERERQSLSMLLGYGSWEQIRFGIEARALNLLGRGHRSHIRLRQSMRSSAGALYYTIPRPLPWLSSGQLRLQGLLREEISFDREEALVAVGVERNFLEGTLRTTAEYRYELLQSKGFEPSENIGDTNTAAGSLSFGFSWDTRDQIVSPRKGASLQGILELASTALGSESNYQRLIIRSSYHHPFDNNWLWAHAGLEGGLLSRFGSGPSEFPTNKRFFPGGENSIRGYKEGEASPLDADGIQIGAEAYVLAHVELELGLSDSLSLVVFTDGLWSTPYVDSGSDGKALFSSGAGVRYSTPLGPLRLEYAHNLNPRPSDPDGTVHLSVGFPF